VCHHSSVSLNKEKNCHEISEDKIAVCKKTQGLRSGNFSDFNSACSKVLVPVKIFQFHDMHYESERYRDAANGLFVFLLLDNSQFRKLGKGNGYQVFVLPTRAISYGIFCK
jgi:hypothetical protein